MRQDDKDPFQKAYETSGRLLSRRPHSVFELSSKLRQREFPREVIDETISKLKSCGFLDDARFAASYFEELQAKGFGVRRIRLAMKKRGIGDDLLAQMISECVSEEDELDGAVALLLKRRLHFARETDRLKRRLKMFRYLASRGFQSSVIGRAVEKYNESENR
jgi:regulatory protein